MAEVKTDGSCCYCPARAFSPQTHLRDGENLSCHCLSCDCWLYWDAATDTNYPLEDPSDPDSPRDPAFTP